MVRQTLRLYVRRRRPARKGQGLVSSIVLGAGLLAAFLFWVDRQLRPALEGLSVSQVHTAVTAAVNEAVAAGVVAEGLAYDDIIDIETDADGRVTVLKSNMARANLLRAQLLAAALDQVSGLSAQKIAIPLGSLTGSDLLSGLGPGIGVRLLSAGEADAVFRSEFAAAGVNQTLHRVMLEVTVTVRILLPGETLETVVSTPVCVAETVIVGQVPDTYLRLERGTIDGLQD